MLRTFAFIINILFIPIAVFSQTKYKTEALSENIATLQVSKNGEWGTYPILSLSGNDFVNIEFDYLSEESFDRLRYVIYHCDAYWHKTDRLAEIEYLNGFNHSLISNYILSLNTTVDYTHYKLQIPNKDVGLKLSGNYVLQVYDEDYPDDILLNACFSVSESAANIGYKVSTVTNIDANKSHQQVSLTIEHSLSLRDPINELKVIVRQNNRLDTERKNLKPFIINPKRIVYEQNMDLIFEAGNEYRRFETSSYRSNGYRVANINYSPPFYEMSIKEDKLRSNSAYSYDQDQNGRYMIRSADTDYLDNETDYFLTSFTLPMNKELPTPIFINGDFTYNSFSDKYRMKYDVAKREYRLDLLLKQGLYNYQYLTPSSKGFTTTLIEGNYHETENEYMAYVYYSPIGQKYDRLIGYLLFYSRAK